MDPNIAFPNPIARTDLPAPRRKWRYIVGGIGFMIILATVFLPQIAASKIGRSALKMYLEGKYRGSVWIGDGSRSARVFVAIIDPGRRVGNRCR